MQNIKYVLLLFFLLNGFHYLIGQPIWLSNKIPADAKKNIQPSGMHHLASVSKGRGKVSIVQWLMIGERIETAEHMPFTTGIEALVFAPSGEKVKHKLDSLNKLSFPNPEEGFYNGYITVKKVSGDTLYYTIAKGELLNHSCRNGHAHVREMMPSKVYPESIPFEIVRSRMINEDFHYFVASGEEVSFKIMMNGEPAKGVKLKLSTEKGWINSKTSDEYGMVDFQFLQDYFTPW